MLLVQTDSYHTISAAGRIEATLSAATPRKIDAALGAFEKHVDTAELSRVLDVARSSRVTPLMFENDLIDRARADRRHLVLPEGTDERILRATETLLRRGVADLTLLGDPAEITRRARELGVEIGAARLVDPETSEWRDTFAATVRRAAQTPGGHAGPGVRRGPRRELLRHPDGRRRAGRRHGVRRQPHHRRDHPARPSRSSRPCRRCRWRPACSSCCSPTGSWSTATARSTPTRTPPSSPTSRSPRPRPRPRSASSRGWRCCPTRPAVPARARTWRRSRRPPRWSASAGRTCRWRARSSTTRRSTRRWRRPSCRAARWPATPRCSSSRT